MSVRPPSLFFMRPSRFSGGEICGQEFFAGKAIRAKAISVIFAWLKSETMMIRKIETAEDIARLAAMADEVWHEFFVEILSPAQIDYMVEKFQSVAALTDQIGNQGYEYYFLEPGGQPVGYAGIRPGEGKLLLSKLYILKRFRGKGYASRAFDFLETVCRERRLATIWLTVNRHNANSIAIYKKRGFETVRTQVADIGNGYVMDDYIMEKPVR